MAAAAAAANLAAAQTANPGQLALLQQQQLFAQSLAAGKETKCSISNFIVPVGVGKEEG